MRDVGEPEEHVRESRRWSGDGITNKEMLRGVLRECSQTSLGGAVWKMRHHKLKQWKFWFYIKEKKIHSGSGSALEQNTQRSCGISILGEFPNSAGEGPEQSALTWKLIVFWTRGCSRWPGTGQPAWLWHSLQRPARCSKSLQFGPGASLVLMCRWFVYKQFWGSGLLSDLCCFVPISAAV